MSKTVYETRARHLRAWRLMDACLRPKDGLANIQNSSRAKFLAWPLQAGLPLVLNSRRSPETVSLASVCS